MANRSVSRAAKAPSRSHAVNRDEMLARIQAFHKTPAALALDKADCALENGIAMASVLLQTLEASPGSEQEATVLRIALEHLESAATHLDEGTGSSARAFRATAGEAAP